MGHRTVSGELHKQVKRLRALGLIEMTIPDKPTAVFRNIGSPRKAKNTLKGFVTTNYG